MTISIKVNALGKWQTLIPVVHQPMLENAMAACDALAVSSVGVMSFRVVDDGVVVRQYEKRPAFGMPFGWYDPRSIGGAKNGTH